MAGACFLRIPEGIFRYSEMMPGPTGDNGKLVPLSGQLRPPNHKKEGKAENRFRFSSYIGYHGTDSGKTLPLKQFSRGICP